MCVRDNQGEVSIACATPPRIRTYPNVRCLEGDPLVRPELILGNPIESDIINGRVRSATRNGEYDGPTGLSP